ncbi:MAG: hypothetical protein GY795_17515 [Desulfobacterales bacterium]|nr:hypothetical protein [Desulfobacterales bacterium]
MLYAIAFNIKIVRKRSAKDKRSDLLRRMRKIAALVFRTPYPLTHFSPEITKARLFLNFLILYSFPEASKLPLDSLDNTL